MQRRGPLAQLLAQRWVQVPPQNVPVSLGQFCGPPSSTRQSSGLVPEVHALREIAQRLEHQFEGSIERVEFFEYSDSAQVQPESNLRLLFHTEQHAQGIGLFALFAPRPIHLGQGLGSLAFSGIDLHQPLQHIERTLGLLRLRVREGREGGQSALQCGFWLLQPIQQRLCELLLETGAFGPLQKVSVLLHDLYCLFRVPLRQHQTSQLAQGFSIGRVQLEHATIESRGPIRCFEHLLFDPSPLVQEHCLLLRVGVVDAQVHQPAQVFTVAAATQQAVQTLHRHGVCRVGLHQTSQHYLRLDRPVEAVL